jgi:fermentation-respiration switch protein FrsA (DUF1100 family)
MSENTEGKSKKKKALWFRLIRAAVVGYVLIIMLMMFFENYLIFPAPGANAGDWNPPIAFEEVEFESADGTRIAGWVLPKQGANNHVMYFYGNGENVALIAGKLNEMRKSFDATVMAIDYRGYGKSDGRPQETGVLQDGLRGIEFFAKHQNIDTSNIIVAGRSLGGSVAVHVAKSVPVRAVVIESTFDALVSVAAGHYPWLPVQWLMRNRFKSINWAVDVKAPLLQFHGTQDRIVPIKHGKHLHESFASAQKTFVEVDGGRHNEPPRKIYFQRTREFIDGLDK